MKQAVRPLTERQRSVMERIDRRVPIKIIAQELSISETRVNQHIRALKDIYSAGSLNKLVEVYREEQRSALANNSAQDQKDAFLVSAFDGPDEAVLALLPYDKELGRFLISGERDFFPKAETARRPKLLPGVLDGRRALQLRFGIIASIGFALVAATILIVEAGQALDVSLTTLGRPIEPLSIAELTSQVYQINYVTNITEILIK